MKISRGKGYSGGVRIVLDANQVNALAKTISSKSSDYANKLIAINNSIEKEIEDAKKELRQWAMRKLGQYDHLTAADVDDVLAEVNITFDAGAVASSNQKIRSLAKDLQGVSSNLKSAAQKLSSTDKSLAKGFKPTNTFGNYKLGFK